MVYLFWFVLVFFLENEGISIVSLFSTSIGFWLDLLFSLMVKKPLDDDFRIYIEGLVTRLIFLNDCGFSKKDIKI